MKVTFELNNSHGSEVRWQRMLDIIRRDLEQQSVVRYLKSDLSIETCAHPIIPQKRSNIELPNISPNK